MKYIKQEKFAPMQNSTSILKEKKVAIVGLGGLGTHAAEFLTRMGVGHIVLIDDDLIEESNLARQGLYHHRDSQNYTLKVEKATSQLKLINPDVKFTSLPFRIDDKNIANFLEGVDLVLDGTDNLSTRYLINDYCYTNNIPWIYASATASIGTIVNFIPGKTPCFRCVYGNETIEDNVSCDINGVILPILTSVTSIQVTEACKILLGKEPSTEEIRFDIWTRETSSVDTTIFFDEECVCQTKNIVLNHEKDVKFYMICSGDSIQVNTNYNLEVIEEILCSNGYQINKKNEVIIEAIKVKNERIVAFKNGKIVCHHLSKDEIKSLFCSKQT